MAIREIPKAYEYTCDACGFIHVQENAAGHYTDSRPDKWTRITFARHAYDFQGAAVADATVKLLLCMTCSDRAAVMINSLKVEPVLPPSGAAS